MESILCSVCGREHPVEETEVFFKYPDPYLELEPGERDSRSRIDENFCSIDEQRYFIRCLVPVDFVDAEDFYCWGVWEEVDADKFWEVVESWTDEDQSKLPRLRARIANHLPYYGDTLAVEAELERRDDTRPFLYVTGESRLRRDQRLGIKREKAVEYLHSV